MTRSNPDGTRSHAQLIVDWHDKEVGIGDTYTYQEVMCGTRLTMAQIKVARDPRSNEVLNRLFSSERVDGIRTATYVKRENWYWPEEATDCIEARDDNTEEETDSPE